MVTVKVLPPVARVTGELVPFTLIAMPETVNVAE
jgi:hypothetical protein